MTCDEDQALLPEHLLGSLDDVQDAAVRRHLRGCAACREERAELEEGLSALARATHDQEPPAELREHILGTLRDEWAEAPEPAAARGEPSTAPPSETPSRPAWFNVAAVVVVFAMAGSLLWGFSESRHSNMIAADAQSYRSLLATLGGKEFRIGVLKADGSSGITGQVLVYDGDPSTGWQSWAVVFAKGPAGTTATPTLIGDGTTRELPALKFSQYGDASAWLVTDADLTGFDRLTITAPDGTVLATASIRPA
jgi:hypothetical protein